VDVVYRADEIVNDRMLCQFTNVCCTCWTDKLGFEADEDVNLQSVLTLKTLGLYEVFLMQRRQSLQGSLGVIELQVCK
jgi:hypothetical protein